MKNTAKSVKTKIKYLFLRLMIFSLVVLVCGCSDSADVETRTEESESIELSPTAGGSIGIFSYNPDTLCPIFSNVSANIQMLNLVFDSLIEVGDHMEAQPCLAESWYSSDGGRIWTIYLRRGVHWHDGGDFTADDVIFTINQIQYADSSPFKTCVKNIASVSSDDGYTLKIELVNGSANFINMLYFPILKKSDTGIDKNTYEPIGTGAFSFHDENEGTVYRLRRNDDWWGGKVYLSSIDVHLLPEKNAEKYMFSSGGIDIASSAVALEYKSRENDDENSDSSSDKTLGSNGKSDGKDGKSDGKSASDTKILSYETSDYAFLGMNHNNSSLAIQTVRHAISLAIRRAGIVDEVLGGFGVAANAPINPSWSVCDNDVDRFTDYDTQKAAALLAENGWILQSGVYQKTEDGTTYRLEFSLLVNEDNVTRTQIAENIAGMLSEFGIKVNVIKKSYMDYEAAVSSGNYDLFVGGYRITPDLDLSLILGSGNVFNFKDEEISELISEIRTAEQSRQKELYGKLQNLFNEKIPIAGLYFEKGAIVTGERIKGKPAPNMYNIYNGTENVYVETTVGNTD